MVTNRLLVQRAKFAPHIMVAAGVSFEVKGQLHFVKEKANFSTKYYVDNLLPKLAGDAHALPENNFVFQQDGSPAHGAMRTQERFPAEVRHCPSASTKLYCFVTEAHRKTYKKSGQLTIAHRCAFIFNAIQGH